MRKSNTNRNGKDFTKAEEKAQPTNDPNVKQDTCGNEIHFNKYGDTTSDYDWEIDHIKPVARGGNRLAG